MRKLINKCFSVLTFDAVLISSKYWLQKVFLIYLPLYPVLINLLRCQYGKILSSNVIIYIYYVNTYVKGNPFFFLSFSTKGKEGCFLMKDNKGVICAIRGQAKCSALLKLSGRNSVTFLNLTLMGKKIF